MGFGSCKIHWKRPNKRLRPCIIIRNKSFTTFDNLHMVYLIRTLWFLIYRRFSLAHHDIGIFLIYSHTSVVALSSIRDLPYSKVNIRLANRILRPFIHLFLFDLSLSTLHRYEIAWSNAVKRKVYGLLRWPKLVLSWFFCVVLSCILEGLIWICNTGSQFIYSYFQSASPDTRWIRWCFIILSGGRRCCYNRHRGCVFTQISLLTLLNLLLILGTTLKLLFVG